MAHAGLSRNPHPSPRHPWLHLAAALLLLLGCDPIKHKTVTRIEPDGRFTREVLLPCDDSLPPEALGRAKTYPPSTQPADYTLADDWRRQWDTCEEAPVPNSAKKWVYFKARGTFAEAGRVPRSYHLIAYPFMDRVSVDRIEHEYDDYELFGIDTWNETITETVSLAEYARTLDEIVRMLPQVIERTLDEILADRYELADFYTYLNETAWPVLKDLGLWQFQYAREIDDFETFPPALRDLKTILARAGYDLPLTADCDAIDDEEAQTPEQFIVELVARKVRLHPTGEPLTEPQARALLKELGYELGGNASPGDTAAEQAEPAPDQEDKEKVDVDARRAEIFRRNFKETHSQDYEEVSIVWGAKLGGACRGGASGLIDRDSHPWPGRSFHYVLTAAGPVIETNGRRTDGDSVEWDFRCSDLWPNGQTMHVRAVRWKREAERAVFGREVFTNVDAVLKAKRLIIDSRPLRDALQEAIEQADIAPLEALAESTDPATRDPARALLELVGRSEASH